MNKKLTAIIFALLCLFTINHSMDLTSQINVDQDTSPEVESVPANSINMAHITEPTTAQVAHEYKDDFPPIDKKAIVDVSIPIVYYYYLSMQIYPTESDGFLTAKKYQSSYLI